MFENEQALQDAGFVLTPNIFNSPAGAGKVYAKSFENSAPFTDANVEGGLHYEYFSVDPQGVVAPWNQQNSPVAAPTMTDVIPPEAPTEAGPTVEPEAETTPEAPTE